MRIIVDAFGGDHAPVEIIKGCAEAVEELSIDITLVGNRRRLENYALKFELGSCLEKMEICDCSDALTMEDDPQEVMKREDCSMAVGLRLLHDGKGDAFASAGNSGALVVGATMLAKRIKGVKRVSFAPIMPKSQDFFMLSDGGANVECRPEMLLQFGVMASEYMEKVMGVKNPRVGLANVGTEEHKGDQLRHEAFELLKSCSDINFIGNIEARDIPFDAADVVVCDGFTGNMIVKLYEGVALAMMDKIKGVFKKSFKTKLAAAMVLNDMKELKKSMDYNEYGGAPIMGAAAPVFKIHGSAKASTVKNALRLTKEYAASGIIQDLTKTFEKKEENEEKKEEKKEEKREDKKVEKKVEKKGNPENKGNNTKKAKAEKEKAVQ